MRRRHGDRRSRWRRRQRRRRPARVRPRARVAKRGRQSREPRFASAWRRASATAAASAPRWNCARAACCTRSKPRRRPGRRSVRHRLRPRRPRDRADVVRVLWPAGILQAETELARGGGDPAARDADHRAGSQAFFLPVPLHVERHAIRVRDRLHGRRRDGRVGGARARTTCPTPTST